MSCARPATAAAFIALLASGCTHRYHPAEYPIATERIAPFRTGAPVRVTSDKPSRQDQVEDQVVFEDMGSDFVTSYAEVNDVLIAQLEKEIRKRGGTVSPDATKTLRVTVVGMSGHGGFATGLAALRSRLQVGDTAPREILVPNNIPRVAASSAAEQTRRL
jgi:hypothetical protein